MPDILHDFPINAPPARVFEVLCSPAGLDAWWTKQSDGTPGVGSGYRLYFGPGYDWAALMRRYEPARAVEWEITSADDDWRGTRVGFRLRPEGKGTGVEFYHAGWPSANSHYRISTFCWAMYLRLLKRHIETGEVVEYERRLDV
jgi:uncharacterized protein YndB with AHSA1/START domain